jgi:hypothetical protein
MAETRVVIQQDPLAEFLNKMPELIFEAKAYGDQIKYQENKDQLNREHEMNMEKFRINQGWMQTLYTKNQDLLDDAANLGLIINQGDKLSDADKSDGFGDITNIFTGNLDSDLTATENAINSLETENYDLRKSIGSYNMGSTLFTQVDTNQDGSISDIEKDKYVQDNEGLDIDFDAFAKGLYAAELTVAEKTDIEIKKEDLLTKQITNAYLPESLKTDQMMKDISFEILGVEKETKLKQLENIDLEYALTQANIEHTELVNEKLEKEIEYNEINFNVDHTIKLTEQTDMNLARQVIQGSAIANKILTNTLFHSIHEGKAISMLDLISQADPGEIINVDFFNKERFFGKGLDFRDFFDNYEELGYGDASSIENDILAILQSVQLGFNHETGQMDNIESFQQTLNDIYLDMKPGIDGNIAIVDAFYIVGENSQWDENYQDINQDGKNLKEQFEAEFGVSIWKYPKSFITFVKDEFLKNQNYELTDIEVVELARYMQYKQMGLLDGDMLQTNLTNLDSISKSKANLELLHNQYEDNMDLFKD